jgi:hypothetical protein
VGAVQLVPADMRLFVTQFGVTGVIGGKFTLATTDYLSKGCDSL